MASHKTGTSVLLGISILLLVPGALRAAPQVGQPDAACRALQEMTDLTVLSASLRKTAIIDVAGANSGEERIAAFMGDGTSTEAGESDLSYCYLKGLILPSIVFHVQLPLPENWNGRFLHWGDGGKDGDLDFADHRVEEGYAVANSNAGHDRGAYPGSTFAFNNRAAEIDFGYRAMQLTVQAAKTILQVYYGRPAEYSYHEGCSYGGRQALVGAQRFPHHFDGIVGGDANIFYGANGVSHIWMMQRMYRDNLAAALAFDTDGDGRLDSLRKLDNLVETVLDRCDALDGIEDGVLDDPLSCDFDPEKHLAAQMCPGDVNAEGCFTSQQIRTIQDFYRGPYDSQGRQIYKGEAKGSEFLWADRWIPHPGNNFYPEFLRNNGNHLNFLFYEEDPGVPPPDMSDVDYQLDTEVNPPEWAWWQFNVDDVTAGKGDLMMSITDATDPDMSRYFHKKGGKMILYHGWYDSGPSPEAMIDYYNDVVRVTFQGDLQEARESVRLFMVPGMGHCRDGPGPDNWDKLPPLVEWVERGRAPDFMVATHRTNGRVDNERPLCPYPQRAVYAGPTGGQNNPANWVARNFVCR